MGAFHKAWGDHFDPLVFLRPSHNNSIYYFYSKEDGHVFRLPAPILQSILDFPIPDGLPVEPNYVRHWSDVALYLKDGLWINVPNARRGNEVGFEFLPAREWMPSRIRNRRKLEIWVRPFQFEESAELLILLDRDELQAFMRSGVDRTPLALLGWLMLHADLRDSNGGKSLQNLCRRTVSQIGN